MIRVPTLIPITGGERSTKKVSERTEGGRGGVDWATVWVETEEGLKKYELVYDYAAGSIKKGKEAQRGRGPLPGLAVCGLSLRDRAPTSPRRSLLRVPAATRAHFPSSPPRVISLQDLKKKKQKKIPPKKRKKKATPPQHEEPGQEPSEGNMELVSDLCLLLLTLHGPAVLALSTRKLRAAVRRCAAAAVRCGFGLRCGGGGLQTCFNQVSPKQTSAPQLQMWVLVTERLKMVIFNHCAGGGGVL